MAESEEVASQWVTYTTVLASVRTVLDTLLEMFPLSQKCPHIDRFRKLSHSTGWDVSPPPPSFIIHYQAGVPGFLQSKGDTNTNLLHLIP